MTSDEKIGNVLNLCPLLPLLSKNEQSAYHANCTRINKTSLNIPFFNKKTDEMGRGGGGE